MGFSRAIRIFAGVLEDSKTDQQRNHHRGEHRKPNQHQAAGGRSLSVRAVRNCACVEVPRVVIHNPFEGQVFGGEFRFHCHELQSNLFNVHP